MSRTFFICIFLADDGDDDAAGTSGANSLRIFSKGDETPKARLCLSLTDE